MDTFHFVVFLLQEEEMMEIEAASTPRGTIPTSNHCSPALNSRHLPPPFYQQQQQHQATLSSTILPRGLKSSLQNNGFVISQHLAPHSEYEVLSKIGHGNNLTTSSHLNLTSSSRNALTKSKSNPTPSPDSAIHSVYYSPSQSPTTDNQSVGNQSQSTRHVSGLSSPFSLRTTPSSSLSRTNSDASQYGSSSITSLPSSVSATTSPISPSHQYSPTHSPIQARHLSGGGGGNQHSFPPPAPMQTTSSAAGHVQQQYQITSATPTTLPSSPLPQSIVNRTTQLSLPPSFNGLIFPRHDEQSRRSPTTISSEFVEASNQEFMDEKTSGLSAQPGISRQQLINR